MVRYSGKGRILSRLGQENDLLALFLTAEQLLEDRGTDRFFFVIFAILWTK